MSHAPTPHLVSWELTRRCDQSCLACRVRGGEPMPGELDLDEALALADQLVAMRVSRVLLSGGEPTLFAGWRSIARRLAAGGVAVELATGGMWLDERGIDTAIEAGITAIYLSIDGPPAVHDALRPTLDGRSSGALALEALRRLAIRGLPTWVVTTASRRNLAHLDRTYEILRDQGARRWQVQLLTGRGRAADRLWELGLQPTDLEAILAVLLRAAREGRIEAPLHCSLGYMSVEEPILRGLGGSGPGVWRGTTAGLGRMHLNAAGRVNGCPCLPDAFAVADVRARPLAEIWSDEASFPYARRWDPSVLAGDCARCAFARTCRAGCPGVAYATTGSIGANPMCMHATRSASTR